MQVLVVVACMKGGGGVGRFNLHTGSFSASFLKQLPKKYMLYNKLRCFKMLASFYFWFKGGGGVVTCSLQEGLRSC